MTDSLSRSDVSDRRSSDNATTARGNSPPLDRVSTTGVCPEQPPTTEGSVCSERLDMPGGAAPSPSQEPASTAESFAGGPLSSELGREQRRMPKPPSHPPPQASETVVHGAARQRYRKPLTTCAVSMSDFGVGNAQQSGHRGVESSAHGAAPFQPMQEHPVHRLVHPQGFRILKNSSALERSLRGYFRLPPAPNPRLLEERQQLQRTLLRVEREELAEIARVTGGAGGVILDGFLLLGASGFEDPEAAESVTLQASRLVSTVPEDLAYFTNLRFLDVSENGLALEDLLSLPALETLHMACNRMNSLAGVQRAVQARSSPRNTTTASEYAQRAALNTTGAAGSSGPVQGNLTTTSWGARSLFTDTESDEENANASAAAGGNGTAPSKSPSTNEPNRRYNDSRGPYTNTSIMGSTVHDVLLPSLVALNLSYNTIPSAHLQYLAYFPCLEKLDLSGNNLHELPADLSRLTSVTHLALENNNFGSWATRTRSRRTASRAALPDVFLSLSTMPSLIEVNLNHNKLHRVPRLSVQDGQGLCFPSIEVIGLSSNCIKSTEDVIQLAHLHRTLRRVVLSNNPICNDPRKVSYTILAFQRCIVDAYWERTAKDLELEQQREHRQQQHLHSSGSESHEEGGWASGSGATEPGPAIARSANLSQEDSSDRDDALWKDQSWARLIPHRAEEDGEDNTDNSESCDTAPQPRRTLDVSAAALAAATAAATGSPSAPSLQSASLDGDGPEFSDDSDKSNEECESSTPDDHDEGRRLDSRAPTRGTARSHTGTTSLRDFYATVEDYFDAHYVNLVFRDASMPKRNLRFFYATQSRADGQSTMVTIPEYKEFMDIYRIMGKTKSQVHQRRRPVKTEAGSDAGRQRGNGEAKGLASEELSTGEEGAAAGRTSPFQRSDGGDNAAFFMTELADGEASTAETYPAGRRATAAGAVRVGGTSVAGRRALRGSTAVRSGEPGAAIAAAAPSSVRFPAVTSASPGGNVHSAMNDLKALLRRPLVSLPYAQPKSDANGHQERPRNAQ